MFVAVAPRNAPLSPPTRATTAARPAKRGRPQGGNRSSELYRRHPSSASTSATSASRSLDVPPALAFASCSIRGAAAAARRGARTCTAWSGPRNTTPTAGSSVRRAGTPSRARRSSSWRRCAAGGRRRGYDAFPLKSFQIVYHREYQNKMVLKKNRTAVAK